MLYDDDAFFTRYLTLIPLALSPLSKAFMIGKLPSTWTYSPEKPTRMPLKGIISDVSMFMPLKASQYNMSVELPKSINTRLTLQTWIYNFMTIGLFSCASTPSESCLKKLPATCLSSFPENIFCETCITDITYLFLAEPVSPPPAKPIKMVLSVRRATWVSRTSSILFPSWRRGSMSSALYENDFYFLLII